jgi:nucleotide-binding universal stress UspA family protein
MSGCVLAAIDLGPSSRRVLAHAAGFARLFSADLEVLYVNGDASLEAHQRVVDFCSERGPYEVNPEDLNVVVRAGGVSDTIYREAQRNQAQLVVMGSRGLTGVAKLLLGSTSAAVLRNAPAPVLLVPPVDLDIINISDRVTLTCGPVLAAVDLAEACEHQLAMASRLAQHSGQPLLLMTVASSKLDDHQAGEMLRAHAHALEPVRPRALIVRRGRVAEEISRCALAEESGLVVMGLRSTRRGRPGTIASAVLGTKRAFVLAVPGC